MTMQASRISESPAAIGAGGNSAPRGTYQMLDALAWDRMLWVVAIHGSVGLVQQNPALVHSPLMFLCLNGGLGVQLFFVISGYCIACAAASALWPRRW